MCCFILVCCLFVCFFWGGGGLAFFFVLVYRFFWGEALRFVVGRGAGQGFCVRVVVCFLGRAWGGTGNHFWLLAQTLGKDQHEFLTFGGGAGGGDHFWKQRKEIWDKQKGSISFGSQPCLVG